MPSIDFVRRSCSSTAGQTIHYHRAMPRLRPPGDPVSIRFDGTPVGAARGEPVAAALIAAGHLSLARSPKFHRPRGPSCFRAACDGCLARVDGVANEMTGRIPLTDGEPFFLQKLLEKR